MNNRLIPLSIPHLNGNELKYVSECLSTGWVSSAGSFVTRFEEAISKRLDIPYAVACMNGTSALHLSLVLSHVGFDDEVIVPTLTFIAPINTVRYVGAHPLFMDCDDSLNLDPQKLEDFFKKECEETEAGLKNKRTGHPIKAIIVVHVYGHLADLEPIMQLARRYRLKVIEDATESLGSYYKSFQGSQRHAGTIGDFGCLSFNGNKLITTGGGGMIVTSRKELAQRARHLTTQAKEDPIYSVHDEIGFNYRMTNIQAAIGVAQMEQLDSFLETKRRNFNKYREGLASLDRFYLIPEPTYGHSNYWLYSLVVDRGSRDELLKFLQSRQIDSRPVWRLGHRQKPFKGCLAYWIEKAAWFEERVLNIPCSVSITDDEIQTVSEALRDYHAKH